MVHRRCSKLAYLHLIVDRHELFQLETPSEALTGTWLRAMHSPPSDCWLAALVLTACWVGGGGAASMLVICRVSIQYRDGKAPLLLQVRGAVLLCAKVRYACLVAHEC